MLTNCNTIRTVQLDNLGHQVNYPYKYKRICDVKRTFNSTHKSTIYTKPITFFEKTNFFTNRQHKFQLNKRVWVGNRWTTTDWINEVFQKKPTKTSNWIEEGGVVESICLRSLGCLVGQGLSKVQLIIYLKSKPAKNFLFFRRKRSLHHLSWWSEVLLSGYF